MATMKFVDFSQSTKTYGCAITMRAGADDNYGTCPASCELCTNKSAGTDTVDPAYLAEVYRSVPRGGKAFTYTHFPTDQWYRPTTSRETTINWSAPDQSSAAEACTAGIPTVVVGRVDQISIERADNGTRLVPCPAATPAGQKRKLSCLDCGGSRGPLCWRANRDYVVVFPAHGNAKRKAESGNGGCYANNFRTKANWDHTREKGAPESKLYAWSQSLKRGTILRHHVAGDIGKDKATAHIVTLAA